LLLERLHLGTHSQRLSFYLFLNKIDNYNFIY
jgi:hypothetical protein